jgi:hypothetical protein
MAAKVLFFRAKNMPQKPSKIYYINISQNVKQKNEHSFVKNAQKMQGFKKVTKL